MNPMLSRRALLAHLGATSAALTAPGLVLGSPAILRGVLGDPLPSGLFSLGVGSGDPGPESVVLWTRLAADPLNGGGVPGRPIIVKFRVALDPGMGRIVHAGATVALAETGHSVHVLVTGLRPDTWYWYDFEVQGARSRIGRTRTFPARGQDKRRLRFALVSCQDYTAGYFAAYRDMLAQELDCVVHVGDYIYEYGAAATPLLPGRNHQGGEIFSLADYRNRYALYRLDADLQNMHASVPFLCTWDDHEVENNYAGFVAEEGSEYTGAEFVERRRNGYRAYRESMALRPLNRVLTPDGALRIYRDIPFGSLASFHLLDTRQYRSDQPAADGFGSTDPDSVAVEPVFGEPLFDAQGIEDPGATLLGRSQEAWLAERLRSSRAQWNILAQQIMVMPWNLRATGRRQVEFNPALPPAQKAAILGLVDQVANLYNVDAWDGYPAARRRLLQLVARSGARNPVVLSGDIHSAWAANLLSDFADPINADMVAAEFVCTSVSSTFLTPDPRPTDFVVRASLPDNPHISHFNGLFRGYCLCDVDTRAWQTTYRIVQGNPLDPNPLALVPQANSPVGTDKVLRIESGFNRPGSGARLVSG